MADVDGEAWLEARPSGVRLHLKVHPRARRERVVGIHGDALKIEVLAAPDGGAANRAVEALLAQVLGVPGRCVQVVAGAASRSKTVEVDGIDAETARRRVTAAMQR